LWILATVVGAVGTFLSWSLTLPLIAVALSLVYYNQKVRKEGFDLLHMMSSLDQGTPDSVAGPEKRILPAVNEDQSGGSAGARCPECGDFVDSGELRCRGCGWIAHVCGECGKTWNPRDYRPPPTRIFCSFCASELARPALPQGEPKQREFHGVSSKEASARELLPERIRCPGCNAQLKLLPDERESCEFTCPDCGEEFLVED
jgi:ssDNA-binding Zn-finger/Zn-ribbon topoisomerase 1